MNNLIGSHYLSLPSQARRKVYLIEYQPLTNYLEPITKEVYFAYISSGSEIFSLDVLNRSKEYDDIVVGLIIIKNTDGISSALLNLYSDYDMETNIDIILETIGQSCESFVLDYIPYGLYHVEVPPHLINGAYENIWLIPGHDKRIHAYRGNYPERCHREINPVDFFPELNDVPSIVLTMQFLYYNHYYNRITCLGCENGYVRCSIIDCNSNCVLKNLHVEYENPVSSVKLFTLAVPEMPVDKFVQVEDPILLCETLKSDIDFFENCRNVIEYDLQNRHCLYENLLDDVCLCSTVADIDFDGHKEIIIGTYCEELILFKFMDDETWKCVDRKTVPNPIHNLFYEDMTDDGLNELIIVTSKGLHIYQHKLKQDILTLLLDRMKSITDSTVEQKTTES